MLQANNVAERARANESLASWPERAEVSEMAILCN